MDNNLDSFFASLFRTYTHTEWSRITGYSIQTLHNFAAEGHPAWRRSRWHPVSWALWSAGIAHTPKKGRKSKYEHEQQDAQEKAVLTLVGGR